MNVEEIIKEICADHGVEPEQVMCKTSVHELAAIKAVIAYVLFWYVKMTKYEIAELMHVHHYTIWRYKEIVERRVRHEKPLEKKLLSYVFKPKTI